VKVIAFLAVITFRTGTASATPLISFTDVQPSVAEAGLTDTMFNWAVQWTQTVPSTNVTLRALLDANVSTTANWWVTTALGPSATLADVVASGTYVAPELPSQADFNSLPRTTLATGLNFAAGSYYLVLDGPPGPLETLTSWVGDVGPHVNLAPGFSLGDYRSTSSAVAFGPASTFTTEPLGQFVFELESVETVAVAEPATEGMLLFGLGCVVGIAQSVRARSAIATVTLMSAVFTWRPTRSSN
jgi:hypothetical protein